MIKKLLDDGSIDAIRSLARQWRKDGTFEQQRKIMEAMRPTIEAMRPLIEQQRKAMAAMEEPQAPEAATHATPERTLRPYLSVKIASAKKLLKERFPDGKYPGDAELVRVIMGSASYKALAGNVTPLKDTILRAAGKRRG
jgi:hypothetical protein